MGDLTDHVASEFKASELVLVAETLGLSPTSRWGNRKLVDAIAAKLKKSGVPNPPEEGQESKGELLLEDFLYIAGYVDDDGNIVKQGGLNGKQLSLKEFQQKHDIPKLPDCFSFADDEDPACKRCSVYVYCAEERVASLPPCFGLLFQENHPECINCLESPFCKIKFVNDKEN